MVIKSIILTLVILNCSICKAQTFAWAIKVPKDTVNAYIARYPKKVKYFKTTSSGLYIIHPPWNFMQWDKIPESWIVKVRIDSLNIDSVIIE